MKNFPEKDEKKFRLTDGKKERGEKGFSSSPSNSPIARMGELRSSALN